MMNSYVRRKRVPTRDTNLGPPNRQWRFISTLAVGLTLLVGGVVPATSWAFPISSSGDGFSVIVSSKQDVIVTYQGNSAAYSNDLYLESTNGDSEFIFNNHNSPIGSIVNLGSFTPGMELKFRLHVNNTDNNYFTGAASRNPDNHTHARVQADWQQNETLISFEDLHGGPYEYNDLSFSFTNVTSANNSCDEKTITGTITADNHSALFYGTENEVTFVGNDSSWSEAHKYTFTPATTDYIYVVGWSDYSVAQGFLGEFVGDNTILTGDSLWQVYPTGVPLIGATPPSTNDLLTRIKMANDQNGWLSTAIGSNGMPPWGKVQGFSDDSKWVWYDSGKCIGQSSPFRGGCNHDEYLLFRLPVSELTSCDSPPIPITSCRAFGKVLDKHKNPVEGATTQVGDKTALTDATGYWEIPGLSENNDYTLTISKEGYSFESQDFQVGDNQQQCKNVDLGNSKGASLLTVKVVPDSWEPVKLDDNAAYTITITNEGDATATDVVLDYTLPEGANLVSIETLDGGSCDTDTINCTLPDLTPGATANVKVVVSNTQPGKLVSTATAGSNEYPTGIKKAWKEVKPYLSVSISDSPDPVQMQNIVHYTVDVDLSHYSPSAATGVELVMTLPSGVDLKSVNTDYGMCDTSTLPTMTCSITDLSLEGTDSVSHVTVNVDVELKDAGLLMLTTEAKITANEHSAHTDTERTEIFIPDDVEVDIAFVIDVTGSMQGEINGVIKAIKASIAEINPNDAPLVALIVFTDDVKIKAFTSDLDVLLKAVENLQAAGGGKCSEASAEALLIAIPHTKQDGNILFATDAPPYENADIEGITEQLLKKGIRFNAMITGDCTQPDSWNELPSTE